jgi:hypothetical protein
MSARISWARTSRVTRWIASFVPYRTVRSAARILSEVGASSAGPRLAELAERAEELAGVSRVELLTATVAAKAMLVPTARAGLRRSRLVTIA